MKNININQFLQTTILENTTLKPTKAGYTFSELICGDNSLAYKQQVINYIKSPKQSKDKNKLTKLQINKNNPQTAPKLKILTQHLKALEIAIKESDFSFYITCDEDDTLTASSKKTQLLLYWILEQFITWKQKPIFKNVEEIKLSLIYFINRVKPEINSLIRYQFLHACDPERFSTIEDIKKFEKESSRTFALA